MKKQLHDIALPAFTLINVMIGIVISGIVMMSFYNAYEFIHEEINVYDERQAALIDMLNIQLSISKDFHQSSKVLPVNENTISIERENDGSVSYHFEPGYILRSTAITNDTFKIPVNDLKIENNELLWVESISVKSNLDKRELLLYFKKEYTALQLMEAEKEEKWQ